MFLKSLLVFFFTIFLWSDNSALAYSCGDFHVFTSSGDLVLFVINPLTMRPWWFHCHIDLMIWCDTVFLYSVLSVHSCTLLCVRWSETTAGTIALSGERLFLATSPLWRWFDFPLSVLCIIQTKPTSFGNLANRLCSLLFDHNKSFNLCKSYPYGVTVRGFIVLPCTHLSFTTPSSCCASFPTRRGFLFCFFCWRSKFPEMWNQRSCCHVSNHSFFVLFQEPLWEGGSAFHLSWETAKSCMHIIQLARVHATPYA